MKRMGFLLLLTLCGVFAAQADRVEWSDGRTWEGTVEVAQKLRFHDGQRVREWDKGEVSRLGWRPMTQRMERAWQFLEAGKTAKQFTGGEYPTEELDATVTLVSGERVTGHLLTTVLYLTSSAGQTDKLVIKHKLRGAEGETFEEIVFPTEVVFGQAGVPSAAGGPVEVTLADAAAGAELAAAGRAAMGAGRVKALGAGRFRVSVDGGDVVWAVRNGNRIAVGWRGTAPGAVRQRLEQGLRDVRDFFDDRRLAAVAIDPQDPTTAWTLLLLTRAGRTTLDGKATQPWRLEVWKWRLGEAADDLTAASRVVLFRGIRSRQSPLPDVRMDAALAAFERVEADMKLKTEGADTTPAGP